LAGFSERLTDDQSDYLEAVSTFIEAYHQARVKWPKGTPLDTLNFNRRDSPPYLVRRLFASPCGIGAAMAYCQVPGIDYISLDFAGMKQ
jgi:hypothetical protein